MVNLWSPGFEFSPFIARGKTVKDPGMVTPLYKSSLEKVGFFLSQHYHHSRFVNE